MPSTMTAAMIRPSTGSIQRMPVWAMIDGAGHHGQRHAGVGGHVQEGAADVQVVVAAAHEQHGRRAVDQPRPGRRSIMTMLASIEAGSRKRCTASDAMAPPPPAAGSALASEARMVALRRP